MPGNLDEAGNNAFFTGYHEAPALPVTRFPGISMKNPMETVKYIVIKHFPNEHVTGHHMDRVWSEMMESGAFEKHKDQKAFEEAVIAIAKKVMAASRVVRAYITHPDKR